MSWDASRFQRTMAIFDAVCDLDEPERSRKVAELAAGDDSLAVAIKEMIGHDVVLGRSLAARAPGALEVLAREGALAELAEAAPGTRVGRYRVVEVLGEGGMGIVYRAHDDELGRDVALKLLRVGAARDVLEEARALARLRHPNVVAVHDVGSHEEHVFMAMELVHGLTLREWLAAEVRSVSAVIRVFREAGAGVAAAHAAGLVHRDFKPSNVIVGDDGRVLVLDFGLARPIDREAAAEGSPSPLAGTPAYMAPEILGGGEGGPRADQFSFAVALWEALHGRRPYPARDRQAPSAPIPRGRVPRRARAALLRALAISPARRHPSMHALLAALRPRVGLRLAAGAAALVLLTVAAAAGGRSWWEARAARAREDGAAAHLVAVEARIGDLLGQGRSGDARAAFDAFVQHDEHQGTAARARAWLHEAERAHGRGATREEMLAYAAAYTGAGGGDLRGAALAGLARAFQRRWAWPQLAVVLETLEAQEPGSRSLAPAELADMRVSIALARRDLATAAAARPGPRTAAPLLAALAHATPTALRADTAVLADTDGDGRLEVVLASKRSATLTFARAEPGLGKQGTATLAGDGDGVEGWGLWAIARPPGERQPILVWSSERHPRARLVERGADGALRELLAWDEDQLDAAACAHAGGPPRCFAGEGHYGRKLLELDPTGGWKRRERSPAISAAGSDITALTAADLDGDGAEELVAALGPWSAYDVRVLRLTPELTTVARRKMGMIEAVATLRSARGGAPLVAVVKSDRARNRHVFAGDATGEPSGVYLLSPAHPDLPTVAFLPAPGPEAAGQLVVAGTPLVAGDLDGDGRDDLALSAWSSLGTFTLLYRQLEDGSFAGAVAGAWRILAAADLDGDGDLELIVQMQEDGRIETLGSGTAALPPLAVAGAAPRPIPAVAGSGELARHWQRAETLVAMGLPEAAAVLLDGLVGMAGDGAIARPARVRAAELWEAARAALDVEGANPAALALMAEDTGRAIDRYLEAGARGEATRLLVRERRLDDALRAGSAPAWLAAAAHPTRRLHLTFDRPLDDGWRLAGPLGVRRDGAAGELQVDSAGAAGLLASLPVVCDGARVALSAELAVDRGDWGGQLRLALRRPGEQLGVELIMMGGGGYFHRKLGCLRPGAVGLHSENVAVASPSDPMALTMEVDLIPAIGEAACRVREPAIGTIVDARLPAPAASAAGSYDLVIENTSGLGPGLDVAVRIRSLELVGCGPAPAAAPPEALARGHRLLADGQVVAALAAYGQAPAGDARTIAEAIALSELRRLGPATAKLRALVPASGSRPELDAVLPGLVRLRDRYGALAHAALGGRYLEWYARVWSTLIATHRDDALITRSLSEDLDMLAPGAGPPEVVHALLLARARTSWRLGKLDAARADLESMAGLAGADGERAEAARLLAAIEVRSGHLPRALELVRRSVALEPSRELAVDRLRQFPELEALAFVIRGPEER